jgi:hypothetical protein
VILAISPKIDTERNAMAVQSSGLETLAEALLQQGFCATNDQRRYGGL